ncbi:hypothetical protein ABTN13_20610, partial [Acinetobacter baumannii]
MVEDIENGLKRIGATSVLIKFIEEKDWVSAFRDHFKLNPIGDKWLIRPSWEGLGDAGGRTVI